jgi:uroporphyrin-III C-methyltransferase
MLAAADYVLHDELVSAGTLAMCGPDTRLENVGKRGGRPSASQADITRRMVELARDGNFVVRLKGGDPFVFGRGGEEARDLVAAGIDVVIVPGVSAAIAAPAAAGIPLTMRAVSSSVAITTADGDIEPLAAAADTLVVLMAHSKLAGVTARLADVVGPDRPAGVVANATLPDQKTVVGTVGDIAVRVVEAGLEAPSTLIVGEVVAHAAASSEALVDLVRFG